MLVYPFHWAYYLRLTLNIPSLNQSSLIFLFHAKNHPLYHLHTQYFLKSFYSNLIHLVFPNKKFQYILILILCLSSFPEIRFHATNHFSIPLHIFHWSICIYLYLLLNYLSYIPYKHLHLYISTKIHILNPSS
jgi:hypothetical protein